MAFEALGISVQQRVDEAKKLHYTLILTYILMSFQAELVDCTVTAIHPHSPRTLLRLDDAHVAIKASDTDDGLPASICPWDSQIEVLGCLELWRYVCQVKAHDVCQLSRYPTEY